LNSNYALGWFTKEKELWGGSFWSTGKYIGTVGEATNEKVVRT